MTTTTGNARGRSPHGTRRTDASDERDERVVARARDGAPEPLELLDDEYAQAILRALGGGPRRGRDIIERCDASRPTVYRRLDRLEAAGFVESEMTVDPGGHHCKEFRLVRDTLSVTVEDGAVTVTARQS